MKLIKFTGTNNSQYYVNPLKIVNVVYTPEKLVETETEMTVTPASVVVNLDTEFGILVAETVEDILDKLTLAD